MIGDISIRSARVGEQTALEGLQTRASLNNPGDREAILAHPEAISLPMSQLADGHVYVAEAGGSVRGFAAVLLRDDRDVDLDGLFVEPSIWRQGVGRKLVDHCARVADAIGANALHVVGNPHAETFYLACGFVQVGTTKTRFGPGLLFKKPLVGATN